MTYVVHVSTIIPKIDFQSCALNSVRPIVTNPISGLPVGSALELLVLNDLNPVVVGVLNQISDNEHTAGSVSYLPRIKATFFILPSVKRFFHETFISSKRLQAASKSSTETQVWPT